MSTDWFEVDKEGLAKLLADRGKEFVVFELLQNAWDEASTRVSAVLTPIPGHSLARLTVEDDNPDGFLDLTHAYTLFAESHKKVDPAKRGRFNFGEKLVLALCESARIVTTTGTIEFAENGTRRCLADRIDCGSRLTATVRLSREECRGIGRAVEMLIPPERISTTYNGRPLGNRRKVVEFFASIPTLIADTGGTMHRRERLTVIQVYSPRHGETAHLYEMGIPVVQTGDSFHVNVMQKVPLNMDRDNVPPAYLRRVRAEVLNHTFGHLAEADAARDWVNAALGDSHVDLRAVAAVITKRFGEGAVAEDPTDVEAAHMAASLGKTVIPLGTFSSDQWQAIHRANAAAPAGKVYPTPRPRSDVPVVPESEWSPGMCRVVALARRIAERLLGVRLDVRIVSTSASWRASYARLEANEGALDLNLQRLTRAFFDKWDGRSPDVLALLIHELGHHGDGDHLSHEYHRRLTDIGARLAVLVSGDPSFLHRDN